MGTRQLTFELGRADISPPWSMIYRVLEANAMHPELDYLCAAERAARPAESRSYSALGSGSWLLSTAPCDALW